MNVVPLAVMTQMIDQRMNVLCCIQGIVLSVHSDWVLKLGIASAIHLQATCKA